MFVINYPYKLIYISSFNIGLKQLIILFSSTILNLSSYVHKFYKYYLTLNYNDYSKFFLYIYLFIIAIFSFIFSSNLFISAIIIPIVFIEYANTTLAINIVHTQNNAS